MELGGQDGGTSGGAVAASASEVGPTEDTVLALLEFLVEPLLPPRSSSAAEKPLSPAQEASVARQVQAVVLLYDYYHRKRNPELEYLDFISFCKLSVIFKPSLLAYMKVMQRADYAELVDLEKELSLLEKMIMEACDVAKGLDTSEDVVLGWPISKVAIFLVDYRLENCFLLHGCDTLGVWSVIEKESSLGLRQEGTAEEKRGTKKKRITKKPLKVNRSFDETGLQQLAFAAVKDACGCSQGDLKVLESHTVYSLSKEKTAARFYIMQSTRLSDEPNYVPIRDVIKSLQGPLVRKEAHSWSITSVVEYFLLLPYAGIISNWFSRKKMVVASHEAGLEVQKHEGRPTDAIHEDHDREQAQNVISVLNRSEEPFKMLHVEENHNRGTVSNAPEQTGAGEERDICDSVAFFDGTSGEAMGSKKQNKEVLLNTSLSELKLENSGRVHRAEESVETIVYKKRNNSQKYSMCENSGCKLRAITECPKAEDEVAVSCLPNNMEVDKLVSAIACSANVKTRNCSGEGCIADEINRITSPTTAGVKEIVDGLQNINQKNRDVNMEDKAVSLSQCRVQDHTSIPYASGPKGFDKMHEILSSKGNLLSETALKVLYRKRDMLCCQLRNMQDEIALCDRNIQTILSGGEEDLAVTLDSVIEGCNDSNFRADISAYERMFQRLQDQNSSDHLRRKRFCVANMTVQDRCQELESMCHENGWKLPTYHVSTSGGGFQANIRLQGKDFECSRVGAVCATPVEARESAASSVLIKLRNMAPA